MLSATAFLLLVGPVGDGPRRWALLAVLVVGVVGMLFAGKRPRDPAPTHRLMTANTAGFGFWVVASGTFVVGGTPPIAAVVASVAVVGPTAFLVWLAVPR